MMQELKERAKEDARLYERYAKYLETEHYGEFVAISREGKVIVGRDDIEVLKIALKDFGKGNFAFRRVGFRAMGKWRVIFGS